MRLHHLEITAFGPFPDCVEVDFDQLSDAGLFLLTGPTGSGKTSVLDAVCFALYGDVPGDRASAKRLRCDQADLSLAPRVTLDCTLAGRRFRVVRSPAWRRPKKRGAGTTQQQASVTVTERIDGEWVPRSSRLDEAGHLITELLGMNLTQFVQVAMLPQGQFQRFLRAKSEERQRLLQRLFATDRFERVERWLKDRRAALRSLSARHRDIVARLISRISEAASAAVPDGWDLHDLDAPSRDGELAAWASDVRREAAAAASRSSSDAEACAVEHSAAREALDDGRRLAEQQERHRRAAEERDGLHARAKEHRADQARRDAARRATAVVPLHHIVRSAERRASEASGAWGRARSEATALLGVPAETLTDAVLATEREAAHRTGAQATALLPRETELATLRVDAAALNAELGDLARAAAERDERLSTLPELLSVAVSARESARRAAEQIPALSAAVDLARAAGTAAAAAVSLAGDLVAARDELRASIDRAQELRDRLHQIQEERITGMASELASALAVGDSCPVCGSGDHPHPAARRPGAPDASVERSARRAVEDAAADRHAREGRIRDLTTELRLAEDRSGGRSTDECDAATAEAEASLAAAQALAAGYDAHAAEADRLASESERLEAERQQASETRARLTATRDAGRETIDRIETELAELLAQHHSPDLASLADRCTRRIDACDRALDAHRADADARQAVEDAVRRAEGAAADAGFPDLAAALDAALPAGQLEALEGRIDAHESSLKAAEAVLADDELQRAAALPAQDLTGLADAAADTERASTAAHALAVRDRDRRDRLEQLATELTAAESDWRPVREEFEVVSRVTALVDGTSADNELRMRLSGFVLGYRLSQVVAAANERLAGMSDRRYSLEHTAQRGAGETRGGLSLLVRDDWSGEARDSATLSGGETFVVSLALALGLADVISEEAGGADLDTLFVDEGFGSLDADVLDDVMDTLDSLRDGGRVVGVVSHVAEMRDRITTRLQVSKHRTGSTLAVLAG